MKLHVLGSYLGIAIACSAHATDRLVPSQFDTIQAAIDAAISGDVVQIAAGTYQGPVDLKGKAITVRGTADASTVMVVGGDGVLRCTTNETQNTLIENLTISGGSASAISGGGIRCVGSSPNIRSCRIVANTAAQGGGVYFEGGAPTMSNCLIAANTASSGSTAGGGMLIAGAAARVTDCLVTGNQLTLSVGNTCGSAIGGGICITGSSAVTLERTTVISNQTIVSASSACCTNQGAGVYFGAPCNVTSCVIRENSNSGCGGNVSGAYFAVSSVYMQSSRICGNTGTQTFGAFVNLGGNTIAATCPSCAGDLNGDNQINGADLGLLLSNWGPCPN